MVTKLSVIPYDDGSLPDEMKIISSDDDGALHLQLLHDAI